MSDSSRRGFLKVAGVGSAAVGIAAIAPTAAGAAPATEDASAQSLPSNAAHTLVVHVTNARTGEMTLMGEGHSVVVHDKKLAAQIASALHRNTPRSVSTTAFDADAL